ncbi:interleukin-1 receptor type 2 isoform X2 [Xyrauchen texanus]|uniref:interleukin-1 receptor type 2 isoform X2 n=1 Tax=Xyrauchen texanus TaxID=154827 RepID=UPI00224196F3|nr:interleukin-1 receptor type 2 isoform X2 [Xyrauchen texanus]
MIINRQCVFDLHTCIVMLSMRLVFTSAVPLTDSCVVVGTEISDHLVQGEAVVIRFPFFEDVIRERKLRLDNSSTFHIEHTNQRNHSSLKSCRDRVMQSGWGILLLPSHTSDSGIYTYTLRSDTFCFTGSIAITIYETEEPNMTVMPYNAYEGEDIKIICPHLKYYKRAENPKWYKEFQTTALPVGRGRYTIERGIILAIRNISVKDEGFYTCRLKVIFNNTQYNVSRTWRVQVSVPETKTPAPETVTSKNLKVFTSSSNLFPHIIFPVNGSFTESHFGSSLAIQCTVSIGNQSAESTDVTWLVDGASVENSYLKGRAFQTDRRISTNYIEVELVILELQEVDNGVQLKCISQNQDRKQEVVTQIILTDSASVWLVVFASSFCFIIVLCVFLYHLCKRQQKEEHYILARQNSTF